MEGRECHVCSGAPCSLAECACRRVERERGRCSLLCGGEGGGGGALAEELAWHGVREGCRAGLVLALEVELGERGRREFHRPVCLLVALGRHRQAYNLLRWFVSSPAAEAAGGRQGGWDGTRLRTCGIRCDRSMAAGS